jgi:hypothetical protein
MHDGERKSGGDSRIDSVAAVAKDLEAGIRREMVHADDQAVACAYGLFSAPCEDVTCALLGGCDLRMKKEQRSGAGDQETREDFHSDSRQDNPAKYKGIA